MSHQEDHNCSGDRKPWYTIAEAAFRWCNIKNRTIQLDEQGIPLDDPLNKCLRIRAQEILYATDGGILPCGRDGRPAAGDHVARPRRTIRHLDLKKWMLENFPGQKPSFLFDEVEQHVHDSITLDTYNALKADYHKVSRRLEEREKQLNDAKSENFKLAGQIKSLESMLETYTKQKKEPSTNSRRTFLVMIAALCAEANIDHQERGASKRIMMATQELGAGVGDDTILKILKEVPDAVESRMR